MHQPVCAIFGVARFALHLCGHDSPAMAGRRRCLESAAGLHRHGIERDRRLLSLRQSAIVDAMGRGVSGAALALIVTGVSMWIAWRDVKISARLMLWIEAVSLLVILVGRGARPCAAWHPHGSGANCT